MSNSEDFFSNEMSSQPKQAASTLRTRAKKAPPPPPPPGRGGATATTKPTFARPVVRPVAPRNVKVNANANAAIATKPRNVNTNVNANANVTASPPRRPAAKAAPVMSRPVGTYYGTSGATTAASTSNEASSAADTWDWSSPAAGAPAPSQPTTNWAAPAVAASTNSWAAPAPAATEWAAPAAASSNDWYTAPNNDTSNNNNNNNMYASSTGYANANVDANTATAATNTAASNPYYSNTSQQHLQQHLQPQQQQPMLSGSMDSNTRNTHTAAPSIMQPQQFMPQQPQQNNTSMDNSEMPLDNEPPLLEELGINLEHIFLKSKAVILPFSRFGGDQVDHHQICQDADLAGPIAFCMLLGGEMVLTGKLQFGYIYGFGLFGCLSMTLVVNLMSPSDAISFWTVASVLGYSLIPVNILGILKLVVMHLVNLQTLGRILGILTVAWSTTASTRLFELGCGLREQRYLIAYPIALLYSAFVLITIF